MRAGAGCRASVPIAGADTRGAAELVTAAGLAGVAGPRPAVAAVVVERAGAGVGAAAGAQPAVAVPCGAAAGALLRADGARGQAARGQQCAKGRAPSHHSRTGAV